MPTCNAGPQDAEWIPLPPGDALTVARRITHDLRSPAGAIATLAELLAEELPERRSVLDSILGSSKEILSTVEQTALALRATYSPRPSIEPIAMGTVVPIAVETVQAANPQKAADLKLPDDWPDVCAVADWLQRVWSVLLSNAWKHGGQSIELGWERRPSHWEFWVRDDGPGLSPVRSTNPVPGFETLHAAPEIRGLSLPLARRLIELMGGCLTYARRPEGVTEFAFTLPRHPAEDTRAGDAPVQAHPSPTDPALRPAGGPDNQRMSAFDEMAMLVRRVLRVPLVQISFLEGSREIFQSRAADSTAPPEVQNVPLSQSFCRQVVETSRPLRVNAVAPQAGPGKSPMLFDRPVQAYLGVPILSPNGGVSGTLCAVSVHDRTWSDEEVEILGDFSRLITRELSQREDHGRLESALQRQRIDRSLNDQLMQHSADCIKLLDDRARLLDMNGPGRCLMEIEDFSAIAGQEWINFWPKESQAGLREALAAAGAGQTGRYQGICPTLKGNVKWWDVSVTRFTDGAGHPRYLSISRDITREKEADRAVAESEARFRTMANHMSQFAWMADNNGWVFWYNQRWLDYTGLPMTEMQGWGWRTVHHPDHVDRVVAKIRGCFDRGEPWEDTFPLRRHDGEFRWFLSRAVPIRDDAGKVLQWFGTNTDITEQRAAEESLRRASQAKDQFIAILSHELRTPLNPALLIASEAVTRQDLPASIRADFETIRASVEMEARLIDDLLDLTRLRHTKLALVLDSVPIDRVLSECIADVQPSAAQKELKLSTSLSAGPVLIEADELRLRQVFANVLRNAVKFTPRAGEVHVRACITAGRFLVEVTDNGIGMTQEELQQAFQPFEQGRHSSGAGASPFGGLGLGLAIAQTFVQLHGGQIQITSPGPGRGTTVTIGIPLTPARKPRTGPPGKAPSRARSDSEQPLRILVVEDHEATRLTVTMLLERRGHTVRPASSIAEAEAIGAAEPFDLILSDLGLPDGRGDELMRRLRILQPELLGVALSGYGMEADLQASIDAGFSLHLTKPVSLEELARALRRVQQLRAERTGPT